MRVPWTDREWKRVLVYGLGLSGVAAARLLRSQGVEVVATDRRDVEALHLEELTTDPGVAILTGEEPGNLPDRLDGVVVSPGVPPQRPLLEEARKRGLPVIAEVELGFFLASGPVIGITGSNGKSTTTAMTGALLEASGFDVRVCGNIGLPLSACVIDGRAAVYVTELSSFQLEGVDTFRPRAAALLNLSEDHLDRYPSFSDYVGAKARLFERQGPADVAVLNADDPLVAQTVARSRRRYFSRQDKVEDGCHLDGDRVLETTPGEADRELFRGSAVSLPGPHNLENAMAAALLSRALGAEPDGWDRVLSTFEGLPHRLQRVRDLAGVDWYDDSKGTNVSAAAKSLEGFEDGTVHLILGGRHKGDDPSLLAPMVKRKVVRLYLIGEAAELMRRAVGDEAPCEFAGDLATAVESAAKRAREGEVVLLSPACTSFDQYESFAARGRHFQELVGALDA